MSNVFSLLVGLGQWAQAHQFFVFAAMALPLGFVIAYRLETRVRHRRSRRWMR